MNILLITSLYPGYPNQPRNEVSYAIHYFAREWSKDGHNVLVIRPWGYFGGVFNIFRKGRKQRVHAFSDDFLLDDVKIFRYPMKRVPTRYHSHSTIKKASDDIIRMMKTTHFEPDVIVCHMINPSLFICKELKEKLNKPLVLGMHNSDRFYLREKRNHCRFEELVSTIDAIAFRSEAIRKEYVNYPFGHIPRNQFIAYSGIEGSLILEDQETIAKAERHINSIMIAANLISLKNVDVLIEAFAQLNAHHLTLTIVGDGPERGRLEKLAKKFQVYDRVDFVGNKNRNHVLQYMEKANVFAMVSSPETFGLVYIEAMAKGCITIGSKGEGIDGVIKDGENGFLCKAGDVKALTSVLENILSLDKATKTRIISNAIDTARNLTQENVSREYYHNLRAILCNSKGCR